MASNDYEFLTRWRVDGSAEEVYDIISRPAEYSRWWPAVYLEVREVKPGAENGQGRVVRLHTKGRLPYTLRWEAETVEAARPHRIVIRATGDFVGRGVWNFAQDGGQVDITFDWRLSADKPLLRYFSFLLKPLFSANHRWAMARGEESLRAELTRRRERNSKTPRGSSPELVVRHEG